MCTMVMSQHREDLIQAIDDPRFITRGNRLLSLSTLPENKKDVWKGEEALLTRSAIEGLQEAQDAVFVLHAQSPTGTAYSAHPARVDETRLWHNGQLIDYGGTSHQSWDTEWLANQLSLTLQDPQYIRDVLDNAKGSFACIWEIEGDIFVFRNAMSPLFYSSTAVASINVHSGYKSVEANVLYSASFNSTDGKLNLTEVLRFNNRYNPYGL